MKNYVYIFLFLSTVAKGQSYRFDKCAFVLNKELRGKKVYYAHPLSIYDKEDETRDLAALIGMDLNVLNPNDPAVEALFQQTQDFKIFLQLAQASDLVAVRAFPDGMLGAGVAKEALRAFEVGKSVFEILNVENSGVEIKYLSPEDILSRQLTIPETIEYLDRLGVVKKIKYK